MKTCPECGLPLTVSGLGDHCARCLLEQGLSQTLREPAGAPREPGRTRDRRCGGYEVLGKIGCGGTGAVYRAHRVVDRQIVALKVLRHDLGYSPEFLARFLREARIVSCLDHPSICKLYEVGQAPDWGWYIAMELVLGPTLKSQLQSGPLDSIAVIALALQVADALRAAHRIGVVHRDIKSSNLGLPVEGRVKLLDFGLAKWLPRDDAAPGAGAEFHTRGGCVLGSPGYMSPEQALGKPIDHRTDLFSLGIVLYEALTGRLPFVGATFREMHRQIVHGEPKPIRHFNGGVTPALERVVERCLRKDPDARFQSASELRFALEELVPSPPGPGAIIGPANPMTAVDRDAPHTARMNP